MAANSGRAGLFTMEGATQVKFFGDLRGTPYTAPKRQKSGALRIEFGKVTVPNGGTTMVSCFTTINNGIMAQVTETTIPTSIGTSGGNFMVACSGSYLSGVLNIAVSQTGQFSGQMSGADINYLVIGY